jgi:WD40 repeat protein
MQRFLAPLSLVAFLAAALVARPAQPGEQPGKEQPKGPRVDALGDPLPDGARARLGTTRFRHGGRELLGFAADNRSLLFAGAGTIFYMEATTGKNTKNVRFSEFEPRFRINNGMAFATSGDTKVLAYTSQRANSTLTIIETDSGKQRKQLNQNELFKNNLNFFQPSLSLTDDGKTVLITSGAGGEQLPLLWLDTTTGNRVHEVEPNANCRFFGGQISRDGKFIGALEINNNDGKMLFRAFDARTGKETHTTEVPGNFGNFVFELRPDGKTLVAAQPGGGAMKLYDYTAGKELKEVRAFSDAGNFVAFVLSKDGKQLFIAEQGKVRHWDVDGGKEVRQIDAPALNTRDDFRFGGGNGFRFHSLALSADGKFLAVAGGQSTAVYSAESGKQLAGPPEGTGTAVIAIRFAPDGKGLVVGSGDFAIQLWDIDRVKVLKSFGRFPKDPNNFNNGFDIFATFVGTIGFSADGKYMAMGMGQGGVGVWDWATGKNIKAYGAFDPNEDPNGGGDIIPPTFAFAPRGNVMATTTGNGRIKLWDVTTGKELRSWSWQSGAPDMLPLIPGGGPGGIRNDAGIASLAFSPDGRTLAGCGVYNFNFGMPAAVIILWETSTGKERLRIRSGARGLGNNDDGGYEELFMMADQMALSMAFSPDGKTLMVGTFNGFHLIDANSGKDLVSFSGRSLVGRTATFSRDGKLLFFGRSDGMIRVIDAGTGRVLRDVTAHTEAIHSLALSADGKTLVSGSNDSTVLIWDVAEVSKPASAVKVVPTAKEVEALWQTLADTDAGKAYEAMNTLINAPAEAVPVLAKQLKAIPAPDAKMIEKLLDDLNSNKFNVRERANSELEKLGDLAGPALQERLKGGPSLEMRQRMEKLVAKLNGPVESPAVLQMLRGVEVLERIGTREAQDVLAALAKGAPGHRVTEDAKGAVERLQKTATQMP